MLTTIIIFVLIFNAVTGLWVFEKCWKAAAPLRVPNPERDKQYPAFCRHDVHKWNKTKLQIGAATILMPRLYGVIGVILLGIVYGMIIGIGRDRLSTEPIVGFRQRLVWFGKGWIATLISYILGMQYFEYKDAKIDYSEYLGPDYKKDKQPVNPSVLISNHTGFLDPLVIGRKFESFYVSTRGNLNIPLVGRLISSYGTFFVSIMDEKKNRE